MGRPKRLSDWLLLGVVFLLVAAVFFPMLGRSRMSFRLPESLPFDERRTGVGGPVALDRLASLPGMGMPDPDMDAASGRAPGQMLARQEVQGNDAGTPGGAALAADLPFPVAHKVIMTARVSLEVKEFERTHHEVVSIARAAGGYVANSELSLPGQGAESGSLTVRVPQARYEEALGRIRKLGRVTAEQQSAEDVTQEYVDVEARLRNLKAEDERILALMKQARSIKETMEVDRRLTQVREQIEVLEGRLRFLQFQVAMATITVSLVREPVVAAIPETKWIWRNDVNSALSGLRAVVQGLLSTLIYLVVYSVLWLPVLLIALRVRARSRGGKEGNSR
ncbi:MAG: DUF4349 domain-containing protein [Armatimonadetes bacterium]|nr:DUF4349 domain-containing protein [Armatimonadota bacterium]